MENIIPTVFGAVIVFYLAYQFYTQMSRIGEVNGIIEEHYRQKGIQILSISKLSMAERIKYGVPLSPYISFFYTTGFCFFGRSNDSVSRSVETVDASGKEHIRYVEVTFSGGNGPAVSEFDVYEF